MTRLFAVLAALVIAAPATAQEARPDAGSSAACTQACHDKESHEDIVTDPVHKEKVTCTECHTNIPDGEKDHAGALDDTPTEVMCATAGCHEKEAEKVVKGKHKDAPCEQCHGEVHGTFKKNDDKACKQCHSDETKAHLASLHANAKEPVTCANCHGDQHDVKTKDDPEAPMSKVLQVSTCGECHDKPSVKQFRHSVHGEGVVKSGLEVAPTCSDCHGTHDIAAIKDEKSMVSRTNIVGTCNECHKFIGDRWKKSKHGELWLTGTAEEKKDAPLCNDCHGGHEMVEPRAELNHLKMVKKCEECHEEASHSYRDSFHGQATALGFGLAATCADCHSAHEMLSKDNPKSMVHASNVQETCRTCHKDTNENFAMWMSHVEPSNPSSGWIHYLWLGMTLLLVGVLGTFSLHTLLWLQRSVVGFARHEFDHDHAGSVWIRRFKSSDVWGHALLAVTFIILSATGLPLKFANEAWADDMARLFGGVGGSSFLHRVAGAILGLWGIYYLLQLVREVVVKKRRDLLWGWKSMTPNLKDARDVLANIRWFLYLGPRPRLDRWSYWEKFDFLAVFWGMPVIGISGLMLWDAEATAQLMPGWILNVAHIFHSDESLMAMGFIFMFHFFHAHLRPESFPLDPVVFTGSMPLERFKAERPLEYERLEASGDLEKYKVAPPTPVVMERVKIFGFTTLTAGVIIAALMIRSFFLMIL